eukprot:SAG11_NODE_2914_length_2842_cov_4.838133_2_plen_125_part_00
MHWRAPPDKIQKAITRNRGRVDLKNKTKYINHLKDGWSVARLRPQTVEVGSKVVGCTFVPLRDEQHMPPSEPRNRSVVGCAFTIPPSAALHAWSVSLCTSSQLYMLSGAQSCIKARAVSTGESQ